VIVRGRVWVFGDNIDTDVILPGKYLTITDYKDLGRHAMEGVDPEFPRKVKQGDIIVAGRNFGCGSSREHAAIAIKYSGVSAVLAESFARIFFRNAINIGLPVMRCPGIRERVKEGDVIEVDFLRGVVTLPDGSTITCEKLPERLLEVVASGGLIEYLAKKGGEI
jgi:3-isopropylmalate/(R)-2-methylmalate dehydratase small subunit